MNLALISEVSAYTDGSLMRKGKLIYCGYGIYFPGKEYKSISRKFTHEPITNNRAELYAILKTIILTNKIDNQRMLTNGPRIKKLTIDLFKALKENKQILFCFFLILTAVGPQLI